MLMKCAQPDAATFTGPEYKPAVVRHLVLFRYKEDVSWEQRREVRRRFEALAELSKREGAPYIFSIETGRQASREGLDHGFEEAFIVSFRSEGDRNYYVGTPVVTDPQYFDPEHQKFKDFVEPLLAKDGVLVFDFVVADKLR